MPVTRQPRPDEEPQPPRSYSKTLHPSILYSNDFDSLLQFLRGRAEKVSARGGETAWIETGEDLRELKLGERVDLQVSTEGPAISIHMGGSGRVTTKELDSDEAKKLVDDTAALFGDWRTFAGRIQYGMWIGSYVLIFGFMSVVLGIAGLVRGEFEGWNWEPFWVLFVMSSLFPVASLFGNTSRVVVRKRSRHDSADTRLRVFGSIGLSVLGGVAGAIVTYFVALQDK